MANDSSARPPVVPSPADEAEPSRSNDDPGARPTRTLTILIALAAAIIALAGINQARGILGPAFLAVLLILTLEPVRARLAERGAPAWVQAGGLFVAAFAVIVALVASLALSISQLARLLPGYTPRVEDVALQVAHLLEPFGITPDQVNAFIAGLDLTSLARELLPLLGTARSAVSALLLMLILVLFLAVDNASFLRRLEGAPLQPGLVDALRTFVERTRRYVVVSTVFGFAVAVIDVAVLFVLGIPVPLVWGLLSFVTNYIPNVGFVLGLGPPALIALLQGGFWPMVAVIVAYSVINFALQSIVQPKVVGDAVGLSVTTTFLSLVVWTFVMGPLGGLLAVPLTLLVKAIFIDADPRRRWLARLLGDEPERERALTHGGRSTA